LADFVARNLKYLKVNFSISQRVVTVSTFDRSGRLVSQVPAVSSVLFGEPKEGLDGLLVWVNG